MHGFRVQEGTYKTGFHVFFTKKDAQEYKRPGDIVVKVEVDEVHTYGMTEFGS